MSIPDTTRRDVLTHMISGSTFGWQMMRNDDERRKKHKEEEERHKKRQEMKEYRP